jgi:NRPS condensation-like uncharacterized protein
MKIVASLHQKTSWDFFKAGIASSKSNIYSIFDFPKGVSADAIVPAVHELVNASDDLKKCFYFDKKENQLFQQISQQVNVDSAISFSSLSSAREFYESIALFISIPFDLECGPLFRLKICEINDRQIILWCVHESIADGYTNKLVGDWKK